MTMGILENDRRRAVNFTDRLNNIDRFHRFSAERTI